MAHARTDLEHMNSTEPFVIILDDLDFTFLPSDLATAVRLWNRGASTERIAAQIRPHGSRESVLAEIILLLMHLMLAKKIKPRESGAQAGRCAMCFWCPGR